MVFPAFFPLLPTNLSLVPMASPGSGRYGHNNGGYVQVSVLALMGMAVTTFVALSAYHIYQQYQRCGEPPMKKSWIPFLGLASTIDSEPIKLFRRLQKEMGEVFGFVLMGNRMFIITDPHSYPLILNASPKDLSPDDMFENIENKFLGITNHAFEHNYARAHFSKYLFADSGVIPLTERMQKQMQDVIANTKPGRYLMREFLGNIMFSVTIAAVFNSAAGNDESLIPGFAELDKYLSIAAAGLDVKHIPSAFAGRKKLIDACLKYRENESQFIASRWEHFDTLIKNGRMKREDAVGYQVGIMWASANNSAPTAFWIMYFLLRHPKILQRVNDEIATVCASSSVLESGKVPLQVLNKLVILNACITETLRMISGAMVLRTVQRPLSLTLSTGTYNFRKGDSVAIVPPMTHFDSEIYEHPDTFNPDRWWIGTTEEELIESSSGKIPLSKNGKQLSSNVAFLPFGGGAGLCPGRKFARQKMKTLVVYLLKSFSLSLEENTNLPEYDSALCGLRMYPPMDDVYVLVN
jgi:cytochrome P450